ncbi:hypothetical protein [Geotalea sp. SG265]|uniref:hypothetical protein n=1 Tax=Geotalea sp. SG265 TaxID=2922867 RepID=UPI001FAF1A13|nr:hypothetical protein [Geotalea sp. SG265]
MKTLQCFCLISLSILMLGWTSVEPPAVVLAAKLRGPLTDEVGTIEEFTSFYQGERQWEKQKDGWLLKITNQDRLTEKSNTIRFAFVRTSNQYVLSRAVVAEKELSPTEINSLIIDFAFRKKQSDGLNKKDASAGVLGLKRAAIEAKLGKPKSTVKSLKPTVYLYCVNGSYKPYIYDHEGHYVEEAPQPLQGNTVGTCSDSETILVMYDKTGHAVGSGYLTVHGNTYDQGWINYLDTLILGTDNKKAAMGAKEVTIPGVTQDPTKINLTEGPYNGSRAIVLTSGIKHVIFEMVGDVDTPGRMGMVWFLPKAMIRSDWLKLLKDERLWGPNDGGDFVPAKSPK